MRDNIYRVKVHGTLNFIGVAHITAANEEEAEVKVRRLKSELFAGKEIVAQRDLTSFELESVAEIKRAYPPEKCVKTDEVEEAATKFPNYVLTDEAQQT